MYRLSTLLAAAILAASVVGCSSTVGGVVPASSSTPTPSPALTVHVSGKLQFVGDVAVATASQGSYTGPFTFTSTNSAVLELSLTEPAARQDRAQRASSGKQTLVSPTGKVYILAAGPGAAKVSVAGAGQEVTTPASLQHVKITSTGKVVLSPTSLTFTATGSSNTQSVRVAQGAYAGTFAESDDCAKIATVTATANGEGEASFTATPIGAGSCRAKFVGGQNKSASLPISVVLPGGVVLSPTSLDFTATGSSNAKSVKVTQVNNSGTFAETNDCSSIATVKAETNAGGSADYTVTPVGAGSCKATFTGGGGQSSSLPISVGLPGNVVVQPANLSFTTTGASSAKTAAVTQGKYSGAFGESDDCSSIATVAATSNAGGSAKYSVTPVGAGSCKATFTGGNGKTASLPISVALPGGVVLKPSSLSFITSGSASAKTLTATQAKYTGKFAESDDCSSIATVAATSNSGGSAKYTVTPVGSGSCSASFRGGNGRSASLPISVVLPGSVVLKPTTVNFTTAGSGSTSVTVTQSNYTSQFGETDTCSSIATVTASSNTGGTAKYTVAPIGPGSCSARFTGGNAQSTPLPITVTLPTPIVSVVCTQSVDACSNGTATTPGSVQFTATGDTATLTPSDPSWTGFPHFTLTSDTCNKTDDPSAGGNWATFSPAAGGSAASFTVTAKNAGTSGNAAKCRAVLTDAGGRTVTVNVEVTLGGIGVH